jgi:hypothetical protein
LLLLFSVFRPKKLTKRLRKQKERQADRQTCIFDDFKIERRERERERRGKE